MKCTICSRPIPVSRKSIVYCSKLCIKRKYAMKKVTLNRFRDKDWYKTSSGKGRRWELYSAKILGAKMLNKFANGRVGDLELNGNLIEVKSGEMYSRRNKRGKPVSNQAGWWTTGYGKDIRKCKFLFFICLKNNKPIKYYMIPTDVLPPKGAPCIGQKSKYDKYLWKH